MTATPATDRIEKSIILKAPRSRVWRAISDARQFGEWFKVNLHGEFRAGTSITDTITYPGFDQLPVSRRGEAFRMNAGGWIEQVQNIERHVAQS